MRKISDRNRLKQDTELIINTKTQLTLLNGFGRQEEELCTR